MLVRMDPIMEIIKTAQKIAGSAAVKIGKENLESHKRQCNCKSKTHNECVDAGRAKQPFSAKGLECG